MTKPGLTFPIASYRGSSGDRFRSFARVHDRASAHLLSNLNKLSYVFTPVTMVNHVESTINLLTLQNENSRSGCYTLKEENPVR